MSKSKKTPATEHREPDETKPGRPPGSPNREYDLVAAEPTRCVKCRSTERTPYGKTTETAYAGRDNAGNPYTHIVRRWTSCRACGQHRIDRFHENRGAKPEPSAAAALAPAD